MVEQGAKGVTPVEIFGRTYYLRGDENSDYLTELASLVDQRMREVSETTGTADTMKVAILACLNIADEHLQAGHGVVRRRDDDCEARLARMITILDDALAG